MEISVLFLVVSASKKNHSDSSKQVVGVSANEKKETTGYDQIYGSWLPTVRALHLRIWSPTVLILHGTLKKDLMVPQGHCSVSSWPGEPSTMKNFYTVLCNYMCENYM